MSIMFIFNQGFSQSNNYASNGVYLEALIGGTTFSESLKVDPDDLNLVSFNVLAAYRWYANTGKRYKPGIQLTFVRLGLDAGKTKKPVILPRNDVAMFNLIPMNIGYTSYLAFNEELGMEFNINLGPGMAITNDFVQIGIHANPNVKFRYKKLAFGLDASILNGPNVHPDSRNDWYSKNTFSATFGYKF